MTFANAPRPPKSKHVVRDISYSRGWVSCECGAEHTLTAAEREDGQIIGDSYLHDWFTGHLRIVRQPSIETD